MYARRTILRGAAALPLTAILADPLLSRAAAATLTETKLTTAGGRTVTGFVAMPETTPAPAMLLIHEWWGLNDQIKAVAADFAAAGYIAVAVDLYDGKVATDPTNARAYMSAVDPAEATETLAGWIDWVRAHEAATGKVGTVGWCFGGGWSLNASLVRPVDATVVYYGNVAKQAADLQKLAGPVMGHFAEKDQWINRDMVSGFEAEMDKVGKPLEAFWYDAEHGFANPTTARYDAEDAALAWERTTRFLTANLG
ncbi:MAG: dienelactone hydrolase family protein [Minwuia sp.]|uniref:dienelactone hydrolase family protein n=1 Tax=Minwuia sp. TaxID=2493630 RepID=UPI003A84BAF6